VKPSRSALIALLILGVSEKPAALELQSGPTESSGGPTKPAGGPSAVRVVTDGAIIWDRVFTVPVAMTQVPEGAILDVIAREGPWYRVRLPFDASRTGYVLSRQVVPIEPVPQAPPEPPPATTVKATPEGGDGGQPVDTMSIPRVAEPPELDGVLAGRPAGAAVVKDFRQNQPGDGSPASEATIAYVSYDDKHLYVIFDCQDRGGVRAALSKRENIADDDRVVVYLDTFHDRRRAYEFAVNPVGVQRDGIRTEGQTTDYNFDTVWRSEARITDRGYAVLIAIPFSSLRFSAADNQRWGIALGRYIARRGETSFWPYITSRVNGFVRQMADLDGIRGTSSGHNAQLVPYGAFTGSHYLDPNLAAFAQSEEARLGLDAKAVFRNAFTLDTTINPDFSQVESDDLQVTVNQRYEVFYPEKRPFFTENANFFGTPERLFFSRRIVDPRFGGRLTGKAGGWALGAIVASDRVHTSSNVGVADAAVGVMRLQREIGRDSFVGVAATSRDVGPASNEVAGIDTLIRLSPTWILSAQAIGSFDRTSTREKRGSAFNAAISRGGRHFTYNSSYRERSPDFSARLGFIQRVDIRTTDQYVAYYWIPERGPLLSFGPVASASIGWDYAGRRQDWSVQPGLSFHFRRQYGLSLFHTDSYELFNGVEFRGFNDTVSAYTNQSNRMSFSASLSRAETPNYSPPAGVAPFLGESRSANVGMTLRPTRRLRIDEEYYFNHFTNTAAVAGSAIGSTIFTNHFSRTKVNMQFSRALSVRAIIDYTSLEPDPSLIAYTLSKGLRGDVLITYLVNPFTAFYAGYTERYDNLEIDPTGPTLRPLPTASALSSRQLFVKISYRFGL